MERLDPLGAGRAGDLAAAAVVRWPRAAASAASSLAKAASMNMRSAPRASVTIPARFSAVSATSVT